MPSNQSIVDLSIRQRTALHHLLIGHSSKCSTSTLNAFERLGWVGGLSESYQLTEIGRQIASASERSPLGSAFQVRLSTQEGET